MEPQREKREGEMMRGEGVCLSACIRGVSRFSRSHVGRRLASVQVLESCTRASADHGSISRAG